MSRNYFASQYDSGYRPKALGNWEEPDKSKVGACLGSRPGLGGRAILALRLMVKSEKGQVMPINDPRRNVFNRPGQVPLPAALPRRRCGLEPLQQP